MDNRPWPINRLSSTLHTIVFIVTADPNFMPPGFPGGPGADQEQDKGRGRGVPANRGPWRGRGLKGRGIPPGFHRNYTEDDKGEALYFESDSSGSSSSGKRKKKKRHRRRSYSSSWVFCKPVWKRNLLIDAIPFQVLLYRVVSFKVKEAPQETSQIQFLFIRVVFSILVLAVSFWLQITFTIVQIAIILQQRFRLLFAIPFEELSFQVPVRSVVMQALVLYLSLSCFV